MSDSNPKSVVARGHNLVVFAPPSPSGTASVLRSVLDRLEEESPRPWLALSPEEAVAEWARIAERLAAGGPLRLAGAYTPARLTRLLRAGAVDLIVTTPGTALELVRRAALKLETIAGILLLWPEAWGEGDVAASIFQDVPKETQRIVVTADPDAAAPIIERYCWRAPVSDLLGPPPPTPAPPVRSTPVAWGRRLEVLRDVVEELDPASLAIWSADPIDHRAIAEALAAAGAQASVTSEVPPPSSLIIAYDLPAPSRLRELASAGEVLLLVPPGTEGYVARLAPNRRPVHPRGAESRARDELERARRTVALRLEHGAAAHAFVALAPLFERYEATAVAAALFELWEARPRGSDSEPAAPAASSPVRIWVGIGKRDATTPNDLVATLTRECRVPKEAIGRIEIRESFSLIEIAAAANPEEVAQCLAGKTVRKRRLVARVDRKAGGREVGRSGGR